MRVIRARVLGFCAGVRRTVDLAREAAKERRTRLFTMGPLIHNGRALRELEEAGFSVLDEDGLPETLAGSVTVIRAHGVGPAARGELLRRGTKIIDATCPKVRGSQMKALALSRKGFTVFIAGEKDHGEVRGIRMFAPGSLVVENGEEAFETAKALFSRDGAVKTAIIGQTTISGAEYRVICAAIRRFFPALAVYDTICGATAARQEALAGLCDEADALVIAGDPASSNTRRLLAVAKGHAKPAWIVSDASCLPPELGSFGTVGLSAGTSTPDVLIGEIERAIALL
ncbi:MAG: 4-hydroxy-3-methylbut-2-enyl diphosphate reductase [Spirochaetaceae bacterium]|jgi:4-hydroxy-3-methylbut-2-enyl diphosphate reductase|nr:4-hydroxy-3-methylbut-2-enyl diphosphate reductase [Spirochaetaceae bacterium]